MSVTVIRRLTLWTLALAIVFCVHGETRGDTHNAAQATTGGMCRPSVTDLVCMHGDAAGLGVPEPTLNLGIGNPIHLATGAKHQFDVDLPSSIAHPDLEIVRHYHSLRPIDTGLGRGWLLSYDTKVVWQQGVAQIVQANGARIVFDRDSPRYGTLRRHAAGWQWIWPQGRILDFDAQGHLVRIRHDALDEGTEIVRHRDALAPAIAQVRHGTASLKFFYDRADGRPRLSAIDSPLGRFVYTVQAAQAADAVTQDAPTAARLEVVTRPDGMQKQYLYETAYQSGNASLPTGVVLVLPADDKGRSAQQHRISAWDYDTAGRAIGVAQGERTAEHGYSRIRYVRMVSRAQDGLTIVDSPAGQTRFVTTLRADQPRLLSVQGAGCPGCAMPGTQASYDEQGRLLSINGMRITRNANGQPVSIEPKALGWPGLRIRTSASGARRQWQSALTGVETIQNYGQTHSAVRQFANGDRIDVVYDTQGRPLHIQESRAPLRLDTTTPATPQVLHTRLQWHGSNLRCVQHPFVTQVQDYHSQGRLLRRTEWRPLAAVATDAGLACQSSDTVPQGNAEIWRFQEQFQYDAQGRLSVHRLPEGGVLHYTWGEGERLQAIAWEDASGKRHEVISSMAHTAGYRYGNGLHLYVAHESAQQMALILLDATGERWRQTRIQDAQGQVLRETFHWLQQAQSSADTAGSEVPSWVTLEDWQYAYDTQHRLIGAQQDGGEQTWLAWQTDGALAAIARVTSNSSVKPLRKPQIVRDASGLPSLAGDFTLTYGTHRRLIAVQRRGETLARYTHNAYGQTIRSQSPSRHTDYLYLGNRLVAEAQGASNGQTPQIRRRYVYAHHVPVGMIVYTQQAPQGELYAIHADLLGAPRMVTDQHAAVRWLASYTPLGEANRIAGDLTFNMRLPGQWYAPETGLHDNLLRTYAPQWGQYLEPDPLGPVPGSQALGYAAQQPRRFVDPLGLLLFAFDGTRHSIKTHSNVLKFLQHYQDGPMYYHAGPGNSYTLDWDAVTAYSAPRILETQWFHLLIALKQANSSPWIRDPMTGAVPVDVIGFSRGAALARHFANLIVAQTHKGLFSYTHETLGLINTCIDLRFIGLLDTVAQFGLAGVKNSDYDFSIAEVWRWVSHAVALHEYQGLFPVSSVQPSQNRHITEAPFIGAHGDIGGGNLLDPRETPRRGDLSDVALNWLWWQAQAAGVPLKPLIQQDRTVQDAVVNSALDLQRPAALPQADRGVLGARGGLLHVHQGDDAHLGQNKRRAVLPMIHSTHLPDQSLEYRVDMPAYQQWLQQELDWGKQLRIP